MKQGDIINDKYVLKKLRKSNQSNQTWHAEQGEATVILKFIKYPMRSQQQLQKQQIIFQKSKHENMVTIFESFTCERDAGRYLVIAMQQCPDGDVARLIENINNKSQSWKLPLKLEFMLQMATAVQHLHGNEVAHRNIKPENVFRVDGRAKLGDLDLAGIYKIKSTQNLTGGAGFPLYKAPQAHLTNVYYLQSDVWSMGLVFLELVLELRLKNLDRWKTEPCFDKNEIQGLLRKIKDVNKGVYDIVMGMLETDRERRVKADWVVGALKKSIQELKKMNEIPAKTVAILPFGPSFDQTSIDPKYGNMSIKMLGRDMINGRMSLSNSQMEGYMNQNVYERNGMLINKGYKNKPLMAYRHNGAEEQDSRLNYHDHGQEVEIQEKNVPIYTFKKEGLMLHGESPIKKAPVIQAGRGHGKIQFTLQLMPPKGFFEQMTDEEINAYLPQKERKKKQMSEWFKLCPRNQQQERIMVRYNGLNDSLIIHYGQFEKVLGMQHLPLQIRFNWPTVEDLFWDLKQLRPEEVDVTEEGAITFRAKKAPNYDKRLKEHQERMEALQQQQQQQYQQQQQEQSQHPENPFLSFPTDHQLQPMGVQRRGTKMKGNSYLAKYNQAYFDSRNAKIKQIKLQLPTLLKSAQKQVVISLYEQLVSNFIQIIQGLFQTRNYKQCLGVMQRLFFQNIPDIPLSGKAKNHLQWILKEMINKEHGLTFLMQIKNLLVNNMKQSNLLPLLNSQLAKFQ